MAKKTISRWDWKNIIEDNNAEKVALRFIDESYTYKELGTSIQALSEQYRRHYESGELIALWLPNCPELLYGCIAGFYTLTAPMPVNSEAKLPELIKILQQSKCRHLIVNEQQAKKLSASKLQDTELQHVWVIDKYTIEPFLQLGGDSESSAPHTRQAHLSDEAALILHTSGSSGQAKGAVISRSSLEHIIRGRMVSAEINQHSISVIASSLSHSVGLYQALAFLAAGSFFVLLKSYDIPKLAKGINEFRPTHLILVVAAFEKLLACESLTAESFSSIQFAAASADRVSERLQKKYYTLTGQTLCVTYGMTELSWVLVNTSGQLAKSTSLGLAAPGVDIRLLGKDGEEVENGAIGEIVARSPKAMLGYLNTSGFIEDNENRAWIASGDLARKDQDGYYWYVGRIKELIGLATGDLVAPLEVENVILEIPGISNCVVLGMPTQPNSNENVSEQPWAVIVRESPAISEQIIFKYLKERISDYKIPCKIVFLAQMPESASGKISRKGLREWLLEDSKT